MSRGLPRAQRDEGIAKGEIPPPWPSTRIRSPCEVDNLNIFIENKKMILTRNSSNKKSTNRDTVATRVLLVENEPIFQQLHFLMLEELGCRVNVIETGAQALVSAIDPYDIIFMDIALSDLKGTLVTANIRNSDLVTKDTPIILLTAHPKSQVEQECFSAGANTVLNKPVTSANFKEILKKYATRCSINRPAI